MTHSDVRRDFPPLEGPGTLEPCDCPGELEPAGYAGLDPVTGHDIHCYHCRTCDHRIVVDYTELRSRNDYPTPAARAR